jgi:pyruvate/2-oxoglutarate dehydrogenase complex dihydrolipoamide acyltransferase (E2) component
MEIRMPKLGMEMTEGVLSRWLVDDGAAVTKDQPIYEVETEKVQTEIHAPTDGALRQIAATGETYPVGALLGELVEL